MKIPAQAALNSADYTRTLRRMVVPNSMTMEDVSIPGNWANVFSKLTVDDEVIVVPEDRTWRLHLLVVERGTGWVKTALLHAIDLTKAVSKPKAEEPVEIPDVPAGYKVNHAPKTGWRVLTEDPAMEVSRNHKTRLEATNAAIEHSKKAAGLAA
jgi:hypothetical protein